MKASTHHVGYGQIEYNEDFWTGKRELTIGGQKLLKKKKNVYTFNSETGNLDCRIKGSFLTGATLHIDQDVIQLSEPCKWYEIFCSVLIFYTRYKCFISIIESYSRISSFCIAYCYCFVLQMRTRNIIKCCCMS